MGKLLRGRALAAVGLALAGMLVVWACSAPVKVGVKVEALGAKLEIGVDSQGNTVASATGSLASGKCLKITFSGGDGAELGSAVVTVPGSCQVPTGAVRQSLEIVDCPPPPPPPGAAPTGPAPLTSGNLTPVPRWREVFTYPIAPAGSVVSGVACHARVWCGPNQDPLVLLRPVLAAGPGAAVPPTIDVLFFADASASSTGATIRVAARQPIASLRFDWNGAVGFGDLGAGINAVPQSLPNSWYSVECFIGNADANDGLDEWNLGLIAIQTLTQARPTEYSLGFQNLAF